MHWLAVLLTGFPLEVSSLYSFDLLTSLTHSNSGGWGHRVSLSCLIAPSLDFWGISWKNCLLVGCLTSQQHANVSQGQICTDYFACCHTEIEVTDPTFYLTQSQYTDTGLTSPNADPKMPGAWQVNHWSANFEVTGMIWPWKIPSQAGFKPWIFHSRGGHLNH